MAQNVLLKYGDTATISGETVQQGKILIDTQKGEISIDKDGTTRLPLTPTVDSALSTTSTNPVQNTIVTTSLNQKVEKTDVVNDLASAVAVTATNVPAGCGVIKELNDSLSVRYNAETNWVQILVDGIWENWSEGLIRELLIVDKSVITSEAKNIVSDFTASAGINAPGYTNNLTKSISFLTGSRTIIGYDVTFNWNVTDSGYPQLVNMKVTFNRDEQKAVTFNGGSGSKTITINNINTKKLTLDLLCNNNVSLPESFNVTITALNARFA